MFNSLSKITQGDVVYKKIDGSKIIILKKLDSTEDEDDLGDKFLARDMDHKKIVIHSVEIDRTVPAPTVTY